LRVLFLGFFLREP